jgi:integrase
MTRNRKDKSLDWLPPRVYQHRLNFVYQPASGGKIILCPLTAGKFEVLKRHEQEHGRLTKGVFFEHIIREFFVSDDFQELAVRTRKDYEIYSVPILAAFGKMRPNTIHQSHVKAFMIDLASKRAKNGIAANPTANKHKALLQKICSWALERGKLKSNPCVGVKKLKERARTRYINDYEYNAIYDHAVPSCKVAMEISYLCMARIGDVVSLTVRDVLEEGLYIEQGKTGKKQIKQWSERLAQAVKNARLLPQKQGIATTFLISKPDGSKYAVRSIQAQYEAAKKLAKVDGCTFHDLKAKGVSDFDGTLSEKQDAAGHTTAAQTAAYDRKIKIVRAVK